MGWLKRFNNKLGVFYYKHQGIWLSCVILLMIAFVQTMVELSKRGFTQDTFLNSILILVLSYIIFVALFKSGTDNYLVAILEATRIRSKLNKPNSFMSVEIFSKISVLIIEAEEMKKATKLNEFMQKIQKLNELKKDQDKNRKIFYELPEKINKLDTEIYLLENSLLP